MDDLRTQLLHCRDILDSAVRRLVEVPQESTALAFEAEKDADATPHGAD
jgi:hypothetical protein